MIRSWDTERDCLIIALAVRFMLWEAGNHTGKLIAVKCYDDGKEK